MIQIRNEVFETNSSSTHSICISKEPVSENDFPRWLNIIPDSYGWKLDTFTTPEEKASYLYSAMHSMDMMAEEEDFKEYLTSLGIRVGIKNIEYESECGVDHGGELIELIHDLLLNKEKLNRFLFNNKSVIYTGSDSYPCSYNCWIASDLYDDDAEEEKDIEHFEYYFKGN